MLAPQLFSVAALVFFFSFLITPITIPLCRALGAYDKPDGKRKINTLPTPRLGGLAFFAAFFIFAFPIAKQDEFTAAILSAGSLLAAGGVADDVFNLPPIFKLFIQTAVAIVTVSIAGAPSALSFFGLFNVKLGAFAGASFAIFKMLFSANAVNFSDGLDGLAGGLSAVALLSLSVYGFMNSYTYPALSAILLASAVLGFLPYNRYPAKTFMGDVGSQFLGFAIAVLSLGCAKNHAYTFETTLFLIIPALDTTLSVVRRLLKRKSPFSADKGHLHHILLKIGVSHPKAVKILVFLNGAVAAVSLVILTHFGYS